MKIEVTLIKKRENYEGPLVIKHETIRIPPHIKILNRKTVEEILRERVKRRKILRDYWQSRVTDKQANPFIDDRSNCVFIAWSPVITTSALEFICQNF